MKLKETDVGKRCTVEYTDVGRVDAMLLSSDGDVFVFFDSHMDSVDADQIVEIGELISPRK